MTIDNAPTPNNENFAPVYIDYGTGGELIRTEFKAAKPGINRRDYDGSCPVFKISDYLLWGGKWNGDKWVLNLYSSNTLIIDKKDPKIGDVVLFDFSTGTIFNGYEFVVVTGKDQKPIIYLYIQRDGADKQDYICIYKDQLFYQGNDNKKYAAELFQDKWTIYLPSDVSIIPIEPKNGDIFEQAGILKTYQDGKLLPCSLNSSPDLIDELSTIIDEMDKLDPKKIDILKEKELIKKLSGLIEKRINLVEKAMIENDLSKTIKNNNEKVANKDLNTEKSLSPSEEQIALEIEKEIIEELGTTNNKEDNLNNLKKAVLDIEKYIDAPKKDKNGSIWSPILLALMSAGLSKTINSNNILAKKLENKVKCSD
jgi:hypothetical protein